MEQAGHNSAGPLAAPGVERVNCAGRSWETSSALTSTSLALTGFHGALPHSKYTTETWAGSAGAAAEAGGRAEPGLSSITGIIDQLRWEQHSWACRMNTLERSHGLKAHPRSIC